LPRVEVQLALLSAALFLHAKVVRIDIDPHEIDRNRMADAGLVVMCFGARTAYAAGQ